MRNSKPASVTARTSDKNGLRSQANWAARDGVAWARCCPVIGQDGVTPWMRQRAGAMHSALCVTGCVLLELFCASIGRPATVNSDIIWLRDYRAGSSPQAQGWTAVGPTAGRATGQDGALRIHDDSATESGVFRATWQPEPAFVASNFLYCHS